MPPRDFLRQFPGAVSYVPQTPGLISGTVRDNVTLRSSLDNVEDSDVWEALRLAQAADFVRGLTNGLDSNLGNHSDELSGGQLQRLGLARALLSKPRLIVLDEATSALDAHTEASIAETLASLAGRTTVIVIAHRLSTVKNADVVHVMEAGRLIASGRLTDLQNTVPLVRDYIRLMSVEEQL
jgi:ATP-binding cassette subfamily C protein